MSAIRAIASQVQGSAGIGLNTSFIRSAVSGQGGTRVTGENITASNFQKIKSSVGRSTLAAAVQDEAETLIDEIEKNVREQGIVSQSGGKHLKDNIDFEVQITKNDEFSLDVGPTEDVFYGQFYEFGFTLHSFTGEKIDKAPKPFMRPAADEKGDEVVNGIKNNILDSIETVAEANGLRLDRGI